MNIGELLKAARADLSAALRDLEGANPGLEAEILLADALETPRSFLYAHPEMDVPPARAQAFRALLARRGRGEPVAYLTGVREFWSLRFRVTPDVLIPRPETELLVEAALEKLPEDAPGRVADIGTGSGAIACAMAHERREADIIGTDASIDAVELARRNATELGLTNARFARGDWCAPLEGRFDAIVSNPPYIPEDDPHLTTGDCRFEPRAALTPGPDGLAAFRAIARGAVDLLAPGGWLLFEHGWDQGDAVRGILHEHGLTAVETRADIAGHDRVTLGRNRYRP